MNQQFLSFLHTDNMTYDYQKFGAQAVTLIRREPQLDNGYSLLRASSASSTSTNHTTESQVEFPYCGIFCMVHAPYSMKGTTLEPDYDDGYSLLHAASVSSTSRKHPAESQVEFNFHVVCMQFIYLICM